MSHMIRLFAAVFAAATFVGAAVVFAATTKSSHSDKLARGKYLVTIMGCNDCHTPGTFYGAPDMKRFLSGSDLGWPGPWGVVSAPNLTSDPETGLGKWTEAQISQAIRTGNRPDGRQLVPIMPWMNFASLTDADVSAMSAYLKTVPPVKHAVPAPVPPGETPKGPVVVFPPPPAWDVPPAPPEGQ